MSSKSTYALAALAGFCALGSEILFLRSLTTYFGDAVLVQATVLATFLLGLSLGGYLARYIIGKLKALQLGLATYAALFFPILRNMAEQDWFHRLTNSSLGTLSVLAAAVILPSLLLGALVPLLCDVLKSEEPGELSFRRVYQSFNAGAILGVFVTEFWSVRHLGLQSTFWVLALLHILSGSLSGGSTRTSGHESEASTSSLVLVVVGLLSLVSALFQAFYLRACFYIFYPHRENFALGLMVILIGLTLGTALARRFSWTLTTCALGAGLSVALLTVLFSPLVKLFFHLADPLRGMTWFLPFVKFGFALLLGLGGAVFFGAVLPAAAHSERAVVRESGTLLCVSGCANAFGYLLYTLFLHPHWPQFLILSTLVLSCLVAWFAGQDTKARSWGGVLTTVGLLVFGGWSWNERDYYLPRYVGKEPAAKVDTYKSGPESATLVTNSNRIFLSYNGHGSITAMRDGKLNLAELLVGLTPALHARERERALVIGLGTGLTAYACSTVFEQVEVVELNRAMLSVARALSHLNKDVLNRSNVKVSISDARAFLGAQKGQYDAIVCTTGDATYFSTAKLHSQEFYRRISDSLAPGGVFCLWLSREYSGRGMEVVLATLRSVFPHCRLRIVGRAYYLLTASHTATEFRPFEKLGAEPSLSQEILRSRPDFTPSQLAQDLELSSDIFGQALPFSAPINTDDYPVLEFVAVAHNRSGRSGWNPFVEYQNGLSIDPVGKGLPPGRQELREALHRAFRTRFVRNFNELFEDGAGATEKMLDQP